MRRLLIVLFVALPLFATESNPTARQRELGEKLLEIMNMRTSSAALVDQMFGFIEKQMIGEAQPGDTEAQAEARESFRMFRERAAKVDFDGLLHDAYIRAYAKYFSERELSDLIAFYSTPTGHKMLEVMPELMREGMEASAQHVMPKMQEVMEEVSLEQERKRPWRRTMADMRTVATGLEAYAIDHDEQYPSGDYASLELALDEYISKFPRQDMWEHSYAYVVSDDRTSYRLVSAGADKNFEWDSRRIAAPAADAEAATRYRERLEDDVIFQDGSWIQAPLQAKPKDDPQP